MDSDTQRGKWDARYRDADPATAAPADVLREFLHLLPASGQAAELACGLGANALLLAEHGLRVEAWDLSPVAIAKLNAEAVRRGLAVQGRVRDLTVDPPAPACFDVLVVSRFLQRELCPALVRCLKPGGLLFYQTYVQDAVGTGGPANPAYRLAPNELLTLFSGLRLIAYREEGRYGDLRRGLRDEALLVAAREG